MKPIDIDGNTLQMLAIAAGCGVFGGFTRWAKAKQEFWPHVLVGLVAAVGAMYVARPTDLLGLVSGALVFGYGGEAVLASLGAHAKVVLSEKHAKEAKQDAKEASKKHHKAEAVIDAAITTLEKKPQGKKPAGDPQDLAMGGAGEAAYTAELESELALEILKKHREDEG